MENNELQKRKRNRLKEFDYSSNGAYFITVCTKDRAKILSNITVGDGALDVPKIKLTEYGKIVEKYIISTGKIKNVYVEQYVIMPNHIHMIIFIDNALFKYENLKDGTSKAPSPTNETIPHIVSTLKRFCNKEIGGNIFQRSYHDHVIRNREDYEEISKYIYENPINWKTDEFYN